MSTSHKQALARSGWVEVSGWDEDEIFFVERAELGWDEFAETHVTLNCMLSKGSIIFMRPIQPVVTNRSNLIPYEAEFVGRSSDGHHKFRLNGVQPRHARKRFMVN